MRRLLGPALAPAVVFAAVALLGLVALAMAWWGVSGRLDVSQQLDFAVSGGIGGLALIITGSTLLVEHFGRCAAADESAALDRVIATLEELADERD